MKQTSVDISKLSMLSNIPLSPEQIKLISSQLSDTLVAVKNLEELPTTSIQPTFHVTGLTNITRKDEIDQSRVLTQEQVLSRASHKHQGFIVVDQLVKTND